MAIPAGKFGSRGASVKAKGELVQPRPHVMPGGQHEPQRDRCVAVDIR